MIDEMKDVMELATGAVSFIGELLKLKANNKKQDVRDAVISSKGYGAKIGSSGYGAKIGSSGDWAKIGSSGYGAKIGSSGDSAKIGSSGDSAKIGSSGDGAQIDANGAHSIISGIGLNTIAKGKKGSWLTLAEYARNGNHNGNTVFIVDFVKTEQID